MLPSMYSGISGLRTHQEQMNVIGNDIANVNTVGYKQSDVSFKEAFVNTLRAPAPGTPGQQVGLGVQMGSITRDFSGGTLMQTGRSSNMGVSGEGFFILAEPGDGGQTFFTRAGDFVLDVNDGSTYLINPDGRRLQGVMVEPGQPAPDLAGAADPNLEDVILPEDTSSYSIGLDGTISASVGGAPPQVIGRLPLATFDNPNGLQSIGNNLYTMTEAASIRVYNNPGEGGVGQLLQGYLENSNVDLAREFTEMITTQRGFQANSRSITTSDEMLSEMLMLKR